jgi:DNA polymerase III alpha subunit
MYLGFNEKKEFRASEDYELWARMLINNIKISYCPEKLICYRVHKNNISKEIAIAIFDEIEGFASYAFNKSHAAAYAVLAYQTAYLRHHYPSYFYASLITSYMYFTEKCHYIYISKISTLIDKIVEKHKKSNLSHIDLNNYKRFIELVTETCSNLHDILENK